MAYRDNVSNLAAEMGISNYPGLREEDLTIAKLRFFNKGDDGVVIEGTDMNRGGRLFLQAAARITSDLIPCTQIPCTDRLRAMAAEYFAELWETNPEPGKRPLLDAIRQYDLIEIFYKKET